MVKRILSVLCAMALIVGLFPALTGSVSAALDLETGAYQVGYARVDINPYVVEDDPSSGIMALPLAGIGDEWDRLSTDGLLDDNGDGVVDHNDGLKATCISITDDNGASVLLITVDFVSAEMSTKIRNAVLNRVNSAIASGELTGLQELTDDQIYYSATHTHSSVALYYYHAGTTGTNSSGMDLSVINDNLDTWIDRTIIDIGDSAILALQDRASAELVKDQLSVQEATSPVLKDKTLNSTRHYFTDIEGGETFVSGDNFSNVYKSSYTDRSDYRTAQGVDPKQVTRVDDNIYLLRFQFADEEKLPVVLSSWRAHASSVWNTEGENRGKHYISSDYVNAYRHALEYGCDIEFDPANGYITNWTLGSEQLCRVALYNATSGNVNTRGHEQVTYSGSEGDVVQYADDWIDQSADLATVKGRQCSYGVVLAQLARECIEDGLHETPVDNGTISTSHRTLYFPHKTVGVTELAYKAALAYFETIKTTTLYTFPYKYTDPETGEVFLIASKHQASRLLRHWDVEAGAPGITPTKVVLRAFLLGDDVAFVTMPGETFDYYYKDLTLTGEARYAASNNLWNELTDDSTFGKPFILGYCNGASGYIPNYDAYVYNQGSDTWAMGAYEAHKTKLEQGSGEAMVRAHDSMLDDLLAGDNGTYVGPCAHCGENQLWEPYPCTTTLTSGHYYLYADVWDDQVKIAGGQNVCLDLNGYTLRGNTRGISTSDDIPDVLSVMDLSEAQTGGIYGCGANTGAAVGLAGGTMNVAAGDEFNLYSGTIGMYDRLNYSVSSGGIVRVSGTMNMYGGKIEGGEVASFTGSYLSGNTVKTATRTGAGGNINVQGTLNLYGGEIVGGSVKLITGTVDENGKYTETIVDQDGLGRCVRVASTGKVSLFGDAAVEEIFFSKDSAAALVVDSSFTGSVSLKYASGITLDYGTDIGDLPGGTLPQGTVELIDCPCKQAGALETDLIIAPDHLYDIVTTAPTCTEEGVATKTCTVCGDVTVEAIPATGHNWKAGTLTCADCGHVETRTAPCPHCGEKQVWQPYQGETKLSADGHYYMFQDMNYQIEVTGGAQICFDLNGYTLTGTKRAFLTADGAQETVSIMDFSAEQTGLVQGVGGRWGAATGLAGGTVYLREGDTLNLYSGTLGATIREEYYTSTGGVLYIKGTFNMYGGKVEGGVVSSFTGDYYSSSVQTLNKSGLGGAVSVFGTMNLYGGQITDGGHQLVTGVVTNGTVNNFTAEPSDGNGSCVWVSNTGVVNLYGDAKVAEIQYPIATAGQLVIHGEYTGSFTLGYRDTLSLDIGADIGDAVDANISGANITIVNIPCRQMQVSGDDLIAVEQHSYEQIRVDATCTEDGTVTNTCVYCGDTQVESIPATGHSYEAVVTDPTCTEAGYTTYICVCGDSYTADAVAATGHSHEAVVTDPTCTEQGYTTHTCSCGDSYTDDYVEATGHTWQEGTLTCVDCGYVETRTAPCAHCGGEQVWQPYQGEKTLSNHGHYYLFEDTEGQIEIRDSANICFDLNGYTFTGTKRAILTADGGQETVSIMDSSSEQTGRLQGCGGRWGAATGLAAGTLLIRENDTLNLYSGTLGSYDREEYYTSTGGVVYIKGTFNMYGGKVEGGVASSFKGSYYSSVDGKIQNVSKPGFGGAVALLGTMNLYGGEITDGVTQMVTGVVTDGTVNNFTAEPIDGNGSCVWVYSTGVVNLYGDAKVAQLHYPTATADQLIIHGDYTGSVTLRYRDTLALEEGADIGNGVDATIFGADITIVDISCRQVQVSGSDLIAAADHSYEQVTVEPTCTEAGYTNHVCRCGDSYMTDEVAALGHSYDVAVVAPDCVLPGYTAHNCHRCGYSYYDSIVPALKHQYEAVVTKPTYTTSGYTTYICQNCGDSYKDEITEPIGHNYEVEVISATCTTAGYTLYTCTCGYSYTANEVTATGHSYENGSCTICGEADPDYVQPIVKPTLTLKAPTLEFKDMITVNAMFTAENIDDVVEMGMITYTEKVDQWSIETAAHVIPGTTYDASTDRYIAASQGIHAKYLGDTVYLACYAKLSDGSYVYTKLAPYSPITYANNQLKKSTDMKLKQLVAAMLNYGAAAQTHFKHNVENLANATLTAEQIKLPEDYRSDMVSTVASPSAEKQGEFANNKGFSKRYPSISFEGAFCINYFFTPAYTPMGQITLYYWNAADYEAVDVLTAENASGSLTMEIQANGEYRGDITGIAAKALGEGVYVAAVYSDGTNTWTSGVLGYSIGAYCASQSTKGGTIADLAMATAVYGYHAKQYFG